MGTNCHPIYMAAMKIIEAPMFRIRTVIQKQSLYSQTTWSNTVAYQNMSGFTMSNYRILCGRYMKNFHL